MSLQKNLWTAFCQRMVTNDSVTPKHPFSSQADHKHVLRVVLLGCALTTDLHSSSVRAASLPITTATVNTVSSVVGFFELLHCILSESRKIFVGPDSRRVPFEIHIGWKTLREHKTGSTLFAKHRSHGRRFSLELHSLLRTWATNRLTTQSTKTRLLKR